MAILEVNNLIKDYPSFSLKDVSFTVEEGSITGFIGRNGAGKTTTLKSIVNLVHFDGGSIKILGKDNIEEELDIKQDIAFALSEINFFPSAKLSTLTNVTKRFYNRWNDEVYHKLLKKFNLDENKKVSELSSGMKVKYNLAIALSHDAKLLLLDEPTSGLDPVSRDEILDIFEALVKTKERAILFSTHITSDLDRCATDIVYIKNGEILASKNKNEFINDYKLITGNMSDFENIKDLVISHKKVDDKFSALISASNIEKINIDVESKDPDLEDIMVYFERGKEDEEFTF